MHQNSLKVVAAPAAIAVLMALFIVNNGGRLAAFMNVEGFILVIVGTILTTWITFPMSEITRALKAESERDLEILRHASSCAMAMGWLGTVFGVILALSSYDTLNSFLVGLALSLNALMFGLFLSRLVLAPLARRVPL